MKYFLFISLFFSSVLLYSQQLPDLSLFRENTFNFNPAVAGTDQQAVGYISLRKQWVNINKSPFTANLAFHTPIKSKNIGLGGYVFNDFIGPTSYTGVNMSFAYHIVLSTYRPGLSDYKVLSFGLSASLVQYRLQGNNVDTDIPQDPAFFRSKGTQVFPDASFGMYYKSSKFFAAFAIPQLLHLSVPIEDQYSDRLTIRKMQHYYILMGGKIHLSDPIRKNQLSLDPAFNLHYVIGAPPQALISTRLSIQDIGFVGVGYRSVSQLVFEGGFTIGKQFSLAYSYDFEISNLRPDLGQVHELHLSYKFNKDLFAF